ncbi:MAG: efflux RND transporter permease subunit, partial [Pseudomonadales bacterium]|nr:efflux RND transporter permease subunit [Pseudomonadales bacterium]
FWPVVASTATTLAAFLPLMFWPGVAGEFMRYLPITVFTVLSGSLLYALMFGPVLGAVFGKPLIHKQAIDKEMHVLEVGDPTSLHSMTGKYARFLTAVTHRPLFTMLVIGALLLGIFITYGKYNVGMVFFSDSDPQYLQASVRARGNFSASEVNALVLEVENEVLQLPGIRSINSRSFLPGSAERQGASESGSSDTVGTIFIEMYPEGQREVKGNDVVREIRKRSAKLAGIEVEVLKFEQGPPVGKPIQIELRSRNRALLEPALLRIRQHMDSLPELVDIDDSSALPSIEWRLAVDRAKAAIYGADVSSAGIAVQLVTNGVKVDEYRPDGADDAVDIRVRYPQHERGIRALEQLRISTNKGMVPLANFVSMQPAAGVDIFERIDGLPVERIRADVIEGVYADAMVKHLASWLEEQSFDPAIQIQFRGANEEQADSMAFVSLAFLLSLLLMFVLLVTQFNSFYQSTLILLAVIMSTAGVLLGLLVLNSPFSAILTGVGVVALAGIVVNNNIVLIDTYNHVRGLHPELSAREVIVRAASQRLRPVLLTTVTTVFGLLPLACGLSVDLINRSFTASGQMTTFWGPLSQAIVFGLSFATILTLIATPAMLALPALVREKMAAYQRAKAGESIPG